MKKNSFIRVLFLLQISLLMAGCGQNPPSDDPRYYIVDLTGTEIMYNASKTGVNLESIRFAENDTISLVVSEGEMLMISTNEDLELYYRYNPDDGLTLRFSDDTIIDAVYLNNEIISIDLADNPVAWEWIEQNEAEKFRSLRYLNYSDSLTEAELQSLKKISSINPDIGLGIEDDASVQDVLSLFSPEWILAGDFNYNDLSEQMKLNLSGLEFVWLGDFNSSHLEFLYDLPKLNSLIIQELDSSDFSEFQFDKLQGLRSLSIVESEIYDISCLSALYQLEDLYLISCDSLEEIGSLVDFTGLKSFGIQGWGNVRDISVIEELPALTRLSLPSGTSQEAFSGIIDTLKSLQVLELLELDSMADLDPLAGYVGLRALSLGEGFEDLHALYQLKDLELLVLEETYFGDSLSISEIRNALPQTKIAAQGGFCLGSGWILLMIPLVLLFVLAKKQ